MNFQVAFVRRLCLRLSVGLLLLGGLCFALSGETRPAHAATTLTVTNCSTDSQLQADVSQANTDNNGDLINFSCSGDIKLSSTLTITGQMTIDGSGQQITLDGHQSVEVLNVNTGANLTLNALTIANGSAPNSNGGFGGGIDNQGTLSISNSTLSGNSATDSNGAGGGIDNEGMLSISNSTLSNNSTHGEGGAIYSEGTAVTISNSTLSNNSAYAGGGIANAFGTLSISNSTLSGNSAAQGGGIFNYGTVNIIASIVAENTAPTDNDCLNDKGTITDEGYNLESGTSCGFTGTGSLQNTNPQLAALANNGGPTQTMALQQGSPAINVIPTSSGFCPATDQRGNTRPDNDESSCDMGAYEFSDPVDKDLGLTNMPANITTNATSSQGATVTYTMPTAVDEDSPLPPVNCTPASGSTFAIGQTTVTCSVSDSDDTNSPVSQSFSVTVQPVLSVSVNNVTASEGHAFSGVVATGTAYGSSNPLSATITWGDSTSSTVSVTPNPDGSYSVSGSHTYAEEGSYPLSVTVKDSGSLSASGSGSANVADASLTLTHFVAGSVRHLYAGLAAIFTDADHKGQVSDYTATVTWGDGHTSTVNVVKNPFSKGFVLAGLHHYARKGIYSVTLTVSDSGGSQVTKTVRVTIK